MGDHEEVAQSRWTAKHWFTYEAVGIFAIWRSEILKKLNRCSMQWESYWQVIALRSKPGFRLTLIYDGGYRAEGKTVVAASGFCATQSVFPLFTGFIPFPGYGERKPIRDRIGVSFSLSTLFHVLTLFSLYHCLCSEERFHCHHDISVGQFK